MKTRLVGRPTPRIDALAKVTGQAVYSVDVLPQGTLHAAVVRSSQAHARITGLDLEPARRAPGVWAVVEGGELPFLFGPMIKDQPFLARDKVRYVGEPVALVAAETELAAQEAAGLIRVDYEPLPAVFDPLEALDPGAVLIHPGLEEYDRAKKFEVQPGTNVCTIKTLKVGDPETGFAQADHVFEDVFRIQAVAHTPLEPHAAICVFDPAEGSYTFHSATDAPHRRAGEVAQALGLPLAKVRFISAYQGGGFGGKGALVAEGLVLVLAHRCPGRPVRLVYSREEELTATQTRVGAILRLKTGVKADGTLVSRTADIVWDSGAYASKAPEVSARGALTVFGPYRIPNLGLLSRLVYTNKTISGAYRGFGTTQVTWAGESQLDMIARRLGLDPLQLRLKNAFEEGDRFINGQILSGVGLKECLTRAAAEIGWDRPKAEAKKSLVRGRGLAAMFKGTNTPTDSACFIKIDQDGRCSVLTGTVEIGAGQQSMVALIAAETIGLPLDWVRVPQTDTLLSPYDFGVTSSRTTFHLGNAVRLAGLEVRRKLLGLAGRVLKREPDQLDLAAGRIRDREGTDLAGLDRVLADWFGPKGGTVVAEGAYSPQGSPLLQAGPGLEGMSSIFWLFVAHAVEIEVDPGTGRITVLKVAAAHDLGRPISLVGCEQQIQGAVIMGLSNALFEEFRWEKGRILNDSLADYKIATAMDIPEIVPILVETGHPEGPFGAKGVGEPAAAPVAPALANALEDALAIRLTDLPLTPEKVLEALDKKAGGRPGGGSG